MPLGIVAILIAIKYYWNFFRSYRYPPFCFRITNKLSTQSSWRQRCKKKKKKLCLSEHQTSEIQNFNTKCLDSIVFFPINSWPKIFEISSINPNLVTPISSNSSFMHLETICPLYYLLNFFFIKYRKKSGKIAKRILQTHGIIHSIHKEKHFWYYFDIT